LKTVVDFARIANTLPENQMRVLVDELATLRGGALSEFYALLASRTTREAFVLKMKEPEVSMRLVGLVEALHVAERKALEVEGSKPEAVVEGECTGV
jgi:hypothetical protein